MRAGPERVAVIGIAAMGPQEQLLLVENLRVVVLEALMVCARWAREERDVVRGARECGPSRTRGLERGAPYLCHYC